MQGVGGEVYTDVSRYLQEIKTRVDKDDYPTPFKIRVRNYLDYFHTQALCDLDRRAPQAELRKRWLDFQNTVKGTRVLDPTKIEQSKLSAIQIFMGAEDPGNVVPLKSSPKKSKFEGMETEHLIDHLVRKCAEKPRLSEPELVTIRFGLFYLQMEALRGRSQRNNDRIKSVWKVIQPLLRRAGFLDELDADKSAVQRLRFFISNHFL